MASDSKPTETSSTESHNSQRRPYHGSCHCGLTRYITYLTFPPILHPTADPKTTIRIRKCNCSTCHKMNLFHLRVPDERNDFLVLSPLSPTTELSDYTCFDHEIHWYFCPKCGVRCFGFEGEGEVREVEIDGKQTKVWTAIREGVKPENCYLSINAVTLESDQEGLDLREWTEKGWINYLDCKDETGENRFGKPHNGGMY